jgi:phage gpG-like protein
MPGPTRIPGVGGDFISSHEIKLAIGAGLRFHRDLVVGWQLTPTIGLVARDIKKFGLDIRSFREPLERSIKKVVIPSIKKNFASGGRPTWEPLAEATILLRGSAGPVLVRTGALARGATQFNIWDVTETSAALRKLPPKVWYGLVHQEGIGGFGKFMEAATGGLGSGASARDILAEAFRLLDEARGGPKGHRAVRIPQRQFVMYQDDDEDDIQQIFLDWLIERASRVGRFRATGRRI